MATASLAQGKVGLGRALVTLAFAGFALGVGVVLALATSDHADLRGWEAAAAVVIGWGFVGAGLYAWWRRPANNFGPLMTATGFLFFVSELAASDHTLVYTLATLGGNLFLAVVVHMLLALPSGRLKTRGERALVIAAYVFASPLSRIYVLLSDPQDFGCGGCPESALLITNDPDLAHDVDTVINVAAFIIFGLTLALMWRKWRRASRTERHALGPVMLMGATAMAVLEVGLIGQLSGNATVAEIGYYATQAAILPLPYAFLASLARSRVTRGDVVSELVTRLGQAPAQGEVRDALARALDDPSLELAYWLPEYESYADADGRPLDLVGADGSRATTPVSRNGEPIAALVHDPALCDERSLLDAVAGAAAIALENVRLNVELRARLEELKGSRARIVEAGDGERRRLERNLHDGAQQRLVGVTLQLLLLENRVRGDAAAEQLASTAAEELQQSLQELRELARGLHPAVLEHGLAAALQALATRSAVTTTVSYEAGDRLPEPVELAAYFVACEALANVGKYAGASTARVSVRRNGRSAVIEVADDGVGGADEHLGTGLRGLADRVEALEGSLRVSSPPGVGTTVTAEMPCGS
jgi:signal transduction histidine kinase